MNSVLRPMQEQVVLITGGSSGLGAAMAKRWAQTGAKVAICARNSDRLSQAVEMLQRTGADAAGFVADLTRENAAISLIAEVRARYKRLDILVNNVGRSTRGLATETTAEQFTELWQSNFLTAVHCTRAALPALLETRGHLVFIGSLAAKAAGPYLGAYPPSKFALAAYAHQLRMELTPQGVHVLLVCPGPIARDDAGVRYERESQNLPDAARRPGGGVQLKDIRPEELADRIIAACKRRDAELVLPAKARWLFAISQLWPSLGDWIIRRKTKS